MSQQHPNNIHWNLAVISSTDTIIKNSLIQEYYDSKGRKAYSVHDINGNVSVKYIDANGTPQVYDGREIDDGTYPHCPPLPPKPNQNPNTVNTVYFKTYVATSKS